MPMTIKFDIMRSTQWKFEQDYFDLDDLIFHGNMTLQNYVPHQPTNQSKQPQTSFRPEFCTLIQVNFNLILTKQLLKLEVDYSF